MGFFKMLALRLSAATTGRLLVRTGAYIRWDRATGMQGI
jgi:hypothetical protein